MNDVLIIIISQFNCEIIRQENLLFSELEIGVPKGRESEVVFRLKELQSVEIKIKSS